MITVIIVRMAWQLTATALVAWRYRLSKTPARTRPVESTLGGGVLIGWSGMRGIVTLAAALALPAEFPRRDLIIFASFSVVLATLVLQGLTLRPLLRILGVHDDDPVGQEAGAARAHALQAGLASLAAETSAAAATVREELSAHLSDDDARRGSDSQHVELHQRALHAARERVLRMRANNEIGDDAFHQVEEDLDWLEMAGGPGDPHDE